MKRSEQSFITVPSGLGVGPKFKVPKRLREQYGVCKSLAEHTEQSAEALKYTMLANGALKGANEDWNLCGSQTIDWLSHS